MSAPERSEDRDRKEETPVNRSTFNRHMPMLAGLLASIAALAALTIGSSSFALPLANPTASEQNQIIGRVDVLLHDELGNVIDERHFDNMVVNDGFFSVAKRTFGHNGTAVSTAFDYIAIGTSSTAVSATQHILSAENARGQDSAPIYNNSTKIETLDFTFGAGTGTGTIRESGVFNSATANTGPLMARQTFGDITKGASDSLQVTWTFTLS